MPLPITLSLQAARRRLRGLNPDYVMLPGDVGSKFYGADEKISKVSEVLRGAARIVNCLNDGRCQEAFDIAMRFTWIRTRKLLLIGIYGCSQKFGDDETAQLVLEALRIAN